MIRLRYQNAIASVVSYLMVAAVAIRVVLSYPEERVPIALLLVGLVVLLAIEPLVVRLPEWLQHAYLLPQLAVMTALFVVQPDGDVFSILLLPACVFVARRFRPPVAWIWIGIFSVNMSVMLVYGHQGWAPQFIVIYLAAYALIGSYAMMLKQSRAAQLETEHLLQELQSANARLQEYSERVEDLTAISERNRLARELHDSVTQTIFSMTLV